jgi:hypothetical protein
MASEPQPSNVQEGAEIDGPPVPTNAEDRKAAAAMSTLEGRGRDDDEAKSGKGVDTEALGQAMKNLNVGDEGAKKAEKKVKVEAVDVTLLVCFQVLQDSNKKGWWLMKCVG